jgi:hypothetical protein
VMCNARSSPAAWRFPLAVEHEAAAAAAVAAAVDAAAEADCSPASCTGVRAALPPASHAQTQEEE